MTTEDIMRMVLGSAGTLVCLVLAIKWLDKDRNSLTKLLTEERDGRIKLIEEQNILCFKDRAALHDELREQRKEINEMIKEMSRFGRELPEAKKT